MAQKIILASLLSLVMSVTLVSSAKWTCPTPDQLDPNNPCECINRNDIIMVAQWIYCKGPEVTQQNINEFVDLIRTLNDLMTVTPTPEFWLLETSLTSLDFSTLNNSHFTDLVIKGNFMIEEIRGLDANTNFWATNVDVENFAATAMSNLVSVDKVGQNMKALYWRRSSVGFSVDTPAFAHVMTRLPEVTLLQLHYDNITSLSQAHFEPMKSLSNLQLGYNTEFGDELLTLGPDSLKLPQSGDKTRVKVNFYKNRLSNDRISPDSGLATLNGSVPIILEFDFNQFEYISAENFEAFLNANPGNTMSFQWNEIVCDSRMKWLKDGRDKYETRVTHLDCTNDEGKTIFTTDLI